MSAEIPAWLALESGLVMQGRAVGAEGEKGGDLVFNTAMSGYHEILTDPSYAGQVVLMTYPQIGNYGVVDEDAESARAWPEAFVMREMSSIHSNHRATSSLPAWLKEQGIVAIDGIDTRELTKHVRERGSLRCVVSTTDGDTTSLVAKAKATPSTDGRDLASVVTTGAPYTWAEGYHESYPHELGRAFDGAGTKGGGERIRVVAYDFGIKRNILRSLVHCGFDVTVVPAGTPADDALAHDPQAIFLSNGPGDPAAVSSGIAAVSDLIGKRPIFGICLGHQILSIVLGAKTSKMPFGHHGANHPVRDLQTGKIEITSQNHSFAVETDSLPDHLELTHLNLNDHTVEGMRHKTEKVMSVQYHPEAAPGPLDAGHLFSRFREFVAG
ncbi:carbamoyl-phosphate synthase small subunit [Engelhardtia mirabilis]|uniref:Carbamoyl phosphate synthase small chain n=1 Tax=Engelhardtia mirabilis TaxID=2528011 RepID=A0A518BRQ4_9BACT|nr:Carbamoyl-phosphate synthase small chain [Planctomycetes bacterium Pla133]QDV03988.1 Carbamoyl-phosphate synthase small chain [Planctomycetes bacterium Pla86]